jgi:hypothetical protein
MMDTSSMPDDHPLEKLGKVSYLSSVPLRRIGEDGLPNGIASGCLVSYGGRKILLTVAHATATPGRWAIELRYLPLSKEVELHALGPMQFLVTGEIGNGSRLLEFSYATVPDSLNAYRQVIDENSFDIISEEKISVHLLSAAMQPAENIFYGFCGSVKPLLEPHARATIFSGELVNYIGLTYARSEGDFHVFTLPTLHGGHENFKGCSGAPMVDESGDIVGLVSYGDESANEIFAFNFHPYLFALDILVAGDP